MKRAPILAAALAAAVNLSAIDLSTASGRMGVVIINNSMPAPAFTPLLNTLGGSVTLSLSDGSIFAIEPSLDVFWTNYTWIDDRAVPLEDWEGMTAFVLGFLLDVPFTATWRVNDWFTFSGGLGLSGLFRVSLVGDDTEATLETTKANVSAVSGYFYRSGRYLYPSGIIRGDIRLQEGFAFAVSVRGFLPVFNAWDAEAGWPFWDHAMLQIGLGMRVSLKRRS